MSYGAVLDNDARDGFLFFALAAFNNHDHTREVIHSFSLMQPLYLAIILFCDAWPGCRGLMLRSTLGILG